MVRDFIEECRSLLREITDRVNITGLTLILLVFGACSTKSVESRIYEANTQEISKNKQNQEANNSFAKADTQESQAEQGDVDSIKNTKGLIVLSEQYGKTDFIRFYNQDGSLWYQFTFYYDDSDGKFEYENENFAPFSFHQDYFVLALKCVGEDADRYEVIVNEKTGLRKFVRKDDKTLKFETWEQHILKTFAVDFDRESNPLRETPGGKIKIIELPKEVVFHPVEISGEWLKVRWDSPKTVRRNKKSNNSKFGWVKWRENNKILIELFYFS